MKNEIIDFDNEFSEKYELYGEMLYKIAFLYTRNNADTEDVLQDVFIKYFCLRKSFKTADEEKAWFIRVTQNRAIDYIRKNAYKNREMQLIDIKSNSIEVPKAELQQDILNKILLLDNKYKTVIVLFYYYDYSLSDISKTLKISVSAAKKRLQRAREKLKSELEDYEI